MSHHSRYWYPLCVIEPVLPDGTANGVDSWTSPAQDQDGNARRLAESLTSLGADCRVRCGPASVMLLSDTGLKRLIKSAVDGAVAAPNGKAEGLPHGVPRASPPHLVSRWILQLEWLKLRLLAHTLAMQPRCACPVAVGWRLQRR